MLTETEALRAILRRVAKSPQQWARLSYPTDREFWTEDEQRILRDAGLTQ